MINNLAHANYSESSGGGGGGVSSVTASSPLASSGGATPNITFAGPLPSTVVAGELTFTPIAETLATYGMQMVDVNTAIQWIPVAGILFKSGSTGPGGDRAALTSAGRLGLGTNTPAYRLDVSGDFRCVNDANLNANVNVGGETSFSSSSENVVSFGQQLVGSTAVQWIPSTGLHFKYNATGLGGFLATITSAGNVGIGTTTPNSKLAVVGLPVYANNAAAVGGGLAAGDFYRTGGDPDTVCVVH